MLLLLAAVYYKILTTYSQPTLCIIKCLSNYLRRFEREIEEILNPPLSELEKGDINMLFKEFAETIDFQNKTHALSDSHEQFE